MGTDTMLFSPRASLALVGLRLQQLGIWDVIAEQVCIHQKVLRHTPLDKLRDVFVSMLAGGAGIVEVNTLVRPDRALQLAFGRRTCADQSTISDTLDACCAENVTQLRTALRAILQQHSHSCRHDYQQHWQLLEADMTGLPAGRLGEGVSKGYFPKRKNCRGRQLGRVLATAEDEILVDRLYDGKRQLHRSLQELILDAEATLNFTPTERAFIIWRVDGGGGYPTDVNWVLARHYQLLVKVYHWKQAAKLARSVTRWYPDPKVAGREVGWVEQPYHYVQPTRQVALRKRKANGTWSYHVVLTTLSDAILFELCGQSLPAVLAPEDPLLAVVHAYDLRGGGVETQNRGDKQGLQLTHRNKHRFVAQEILVLLAQLAHDVVIWTRNDLVVVNPRLAQYGVQRLVRDALQIPGWVHVNAAGKVTQVVLCAEHPLADAFYRAFTDVKVSLHLGQK